jgi:hypothetical protein
MQYQELPPVALFLQKNIVFFIKGFPFQSGLFPIWLEVIKKAIDKDSFF